VIWLEHVVHGDLGRSIVTGNPVLTDIATRLPATLELITSAILISILVLVPIGVLTARRSHRLLGRIAERTVFTYGMFAGAAPDFWLGLMLIFIFYFKLHLAPAPIGQLDVSAEPPKAVTNFLVIDSALAGNITALSSALTHMVLPVITLTFVYGAPILKMTQQTVTRMLEAEFVQQARAAGLSQRTQLTMALKNSLPPIITLVGITFGYIVGGAVLVETVFSWGGLGQYAVQAITNADFAAIQGFVLVATAISILIYLIVDLLYHWIDPRL
jgi:peptide/nickel transport system permease protein